MGRLRRALLTAPGPAPRRGATGAVVLAAAVAGLLAPAAAPGTAWSAARSAAGSGHSGTTTGSGLVLLSQTPWVAPGQPMQLHLSLGSQSRNDVTLGITLYQRLTSRSAFAETVSGTSVGVPLASTQVPAASLPSDPQGGVDVTVPIASGDAPAAGSGQLAADLHCAAGACGGVYPLRLQLLSSTGGRSQLITYVVYADPPAATQKLRFALVLPFASPPRPADRSGKVAAIDTAQVTRLETLTGALNGHDMPVTLDPEAATMAGLVTAGRSRARAAAGAITALAGAPQHETLSDSFVPVDATALVSGGLSGELDDQVHRAAQLLAPMHPTAGTWVATGALDQGSMATLAQLGYDRLVVSPTAVSQPSGSSLTQTRPFTLNAGKGPTDVAVASDPSLSAHLAAGSGSGAALAAYQLLADLALVYYEQPNLETPRGVVAVPPEGWAPSALFLDTVLSALPADPVVSPVTLEQVFTAVPLATGTARRPIGPTGGTTLPARQIRSARSRLSAFGGSVGDSGLGEVRSLDDALLAAEDTGLRPGQQQQAVAGAGAALDAQLAKLSIRTDTIRLTSTAAKVPVTLVKQAGYTVSGRLEIVGDKVVFPPVGQQDPGAVCRDPTVQSSAERSRFECTATMGLPTNAVYVAMRARATGDFRLTVTLTSPNGGLVLASSHLTVRSMSTSLVAIGLSAAAVAVLLAWWGRTLWRGRRRGAHARGAARDA